jgi:hypothetical protein
MVKIVIGYPGERVVSEFDALVARPTVPATAPQPPLGLVEISQRLPTELIPGPVGPQGVRGSRWFTGSSAPSTISGQATGDMYLDNTIDEVWQFDGATWIDTGTNIAGSPDTGAQILAKLAPVDGAGSGLDADLLDGEHAASLHAWANLTGKPATFPPTLPIAESDVTNLVPDLAAKAPLASPSLTGTPLAPTAAANTNTTQIATTAFVEAATAPAQLLSDIKTVDGVGSGLDADLLDGQDSAYYLALANATGAISDTQHGNRGGGALHALATAAVAGFLLDAPSDGTSYARRNAAWIATSAFVDAPSDGGFYGRVNGAWSVQYTKAALDTLLAAKVAGPAASTDNALARFDLATGKVIQNSGAILDDSNNLNIGAGGFTTTGQINVGTVIASGTVQAGSGIFQGLGATPIFTGTVSNATLYMRPAGYANSSAEWRFDYDGNIKNIYGWFSGNTWRALAAAGGNMIIGGDAGAATNIYLRPIYNQTPGVTVDTGGHVTCSGQLTTGSQILAGNGTYTSNGGIILGTGGVSTMWLRPSGAGSTTGQATIAQGGNSNWSHDSQAKPTAGQWAGGSDARIKTVLRDYTAGLDAILALQPKVFTYKGNDTLHPPDEDPALAFQNEDGNTKLIGKEYTTVPYRMSTHYELARDGAERVGMVAQDIETVLPETVTPIAGYIDGQPVDDMRIFDPTNIMYALVNAVKELTARVEALEAR